MNEADKAIAKVVTEENVVFDFNLTPERKEGEDFELYKVRRRYENFMVAQHLKGRVVWDSKTKGQFVRGG